jgi:hypothetical protein
MRAAFADQVRGSGYRDVVNSRLLGVELAILNARVRELGIDPAEIVIDALRGPGRVIPPARNVVFARGSRVLSKLAIELVFRLRQSRKSACRCCDFLHLVRWL